jgi:BirA family transcriptional regulator, biotin operon repressor / biotin---[acetyl-CoA-carboxylase] ligase
VVTALCYIIAMNGAPDIVTYIQANLRTRFIGRALHYMEETPSTQDVARELAEKWAPEGTAVIAGTQKAGRGRLGRIWFSPEGGLAVSIVLRPPLDAIQLLPAVTSVAVFRTLQKLGINSAIKWPNDVLIQGKKVCGILIENGLDGGKLKYSIQGIGINVNFNTTQFPEIADISTSLSVELGHDASIGEVAVLLFGELEDVYGQISDPAYVIGEWMCNMQTIGRRIKVSTGSLVVEGIARSINAAGNLIMVLDDGTLKEIIAGDVTLLKK